MFKNSTIVKSGDMFFKHTIIVLQYSDFVSNVAVKSVRANASALLSPILFDIFKSLVFVFFDGACFIKYPFIT